MSKLQKLRNNLLSGNAVSVLGPLQYTKYLASFLVNAPRIRSVADLRPLDRAMGKTAKRFHYRRSSFLFDCGFCDDRLKEESFAFGLAREVFIRDCYFKWHPSSVYRGARIVVDLGANRGAFSSLMTTKAKFILSVECQEQYVPIIQHNMLINKFPSYAIETAFVGAGGSDASSNAPRLTVDELFQRHSIESVDLLKVDIEGSEFALFESANWLQRVNAISMEVHPHYGNPRDIVERVAEQGFAYALADEDMNCVNEAENANFIYAWRRTSD